MSFNLDTYSIPERIAVDKALGYSYFMDRDHPLSDKKGRVWLHRHIASVEAGRLVLPEEVVHHTDHNRRNNAPSNLEILTRGEHARVHSPRILREKTCEYCQEAFRPRNHRQRFCSPRCAQCSRRSVGRPSAEQLAEDLESMSWCAVGRKYGVSDNAVRKWARVEGLLA